MGVFVSRSLLRGAVLVTLLSCTSSNGCHEPSAPATRLGLVRLVRLVRLQINPTILGHGEDD
jgi:hypothetical protein